MTEERVIHFTKPDKATAIYLIILSLLSVIFLFQSFNLFNIIPVDKVLSLIGQSSTPLVLFLSIFLSFGIYFLINLVIELLYSFFLNEKIYEKQRSKFFGTFAIAFITIWISFFTFGLLIAFKIFPNRFENEFLNYYLFWFLFIKIVVSFFTSDAKSEQLAEPLKLTDNRITWFKHLFMGEKIELITEPLGDVIYKQGIIPKIIILIILAFILPNNAFIIGLMMAFLHMPVSPPVAEVPLKSIFIVFLLAAAFGVLYAIGILLNNRLVVYKNAIRIPLPVVKDFPLFTFILPKSTIVIPASIVKDCNVKKVDYGRSRGSRLRRSIHILELHLKDGRKIKSALFVMNPQEVEDKIKSLIH